MQLLMILLSLESIPNEPISENKEEDDHFKDGPETGNVLTE